LRLIFDQNVPESVVGFLEGRGHEVQRARDLLLAQAPDEVLAAVGARNEAIVVSWDKDFKVLASKMPSGTKTRFRKLGRINFQCKESQGRTRLEQVIELVDFAYARAQERADKRFIAIIGASFVRFDL
jgi:predicted nuclease of predicted toxin-antitoxin system